MGDISEPPIPVRLDIELKELFAENVAAKLFIVAKRLLKEQVTPNTTLDRRLLTNVITRTMFYFSTQRRYLKQEIAQADMQ